MKKFDAAVIGYGKGSKNLVPSLASAGMKVAFIEKSDRMYGGTCPNTGCVPTKFLVNRSELAEVKGFAGFEEKAAWYAQAIKDKKALREMILGKMYGAATNISGAEFFHAAASFVSARELHLEGPGIDENIMADRIIIDTGSYPFIPPIDGINESKRVYTSEGMLDLEGLPRRLVIIGGGNIGLEFASFYRRFGSDVIILQDLADFMPAEDEDMAKCVREAMEERGLKMEFGVKVLSVNDGPSGATVKYSVKGEERAADGDAVLISTGRRPFTKGLNLDAAGVNITPRGFIAVDERLRTSAPNVWAMGDVAGSPQFTYISLDDSRVILSDINGGSRTTDRLVPYSVFLSPSLSRVGLTEKAALAAGHRVKTAVLSPKSIPRCHTLGKYTGMLKAAVDADTGAILGVSLFCEESHEMINTVKLAMDCKLPYTALRDTIFTHPVMTEALNDLFAMIK